MDQVELAVDPGPLGQLEQEAVLDLDADGFDFQLDGVFDQADENQQGVHAVTAESAANQVDEIGYEDEEEEEARLEHVATDSAEAEGPAKDLAGDEIAGAGLEYQEEIGYEEDYSLTTEVVKADENVQDLAITDAEQPLYQAEDELALQHEDQPEYEVENQAEPEFEAEDQSGPQHEDQPEREAEEQSEPRHESSSGQTQAQAPEDQAVSLSNIDSVKPVAEEDFDQQLDHDDDDEKENVPEMDSQSDMDYDAGSNHAHDDEDYLMDHEEEPRAGLSEVDKAIEDLASSLHGVPDVEVFYNDVNYSLFGTSNDDPDSYFLSDVNKLDEPLAQFLSSLRQVIANEIAPTDTLLVSFDSLDLEFGERSSEKFLSRTLRELLDCHAALAAKDTAITSIPVLQLIVQHDCEERFLQLLDEAKYGGESPYHSGSEVSDHEHSEHNESDHQDGWPNEELQVDEDDDMAHDSYENEAPVNGIASTHHESRNISVSPAAQTVDDFKLETEAENGDAAQKEVAGTPSAHSQSPEVAAEGQSDYDNQAEHQAILETVNAEDSKPSDFTQEDVSYEPADDHVDEQEMKDADEEFDVITDLETTEEVQITSNGVLEQTTGSNDDDLLLAFDQDGGLSTIDEQAGDDGQGEEISNVVPEVPDTLADNEEDALETDWQAEISQISRAISPAMSKNSQHGPSVAATGDTTSDHTSTTMNGDEIDYDEHDGADDSFTPDNSAPHSVVAPAEDGDEIDWGNDGDEYEEGHDEAEGDITYEAHPDLEVTPSSPTGKRYRTDDAESLAEETDHKRRRT
ncbi:hypothetical protein QBC41DRAFT_52613 [Cercophora samala]|uniref:Uncharacterized protein n=1 Tax=Cercophora samala TaxID=330535 RepID=A0AA39ZN61_9PEZI|nr:hypothetical protein QBC41DRAFT_52613 [Cercophora samala]